MQAYLYGFPWAYMPDARWTRTEAIDRQADRFHHVRKLEDAEHLNGGAPNNDTLYSRAWVSLKDEPVILSVPEIRDRYYTMEIVDFMGDNFAYVGTRATGAKAGNYAIVGPGWKGKLPAGVMATCPFVDTWATILGRTFVKRRRRARCRSLHPRPIQTHPPLTVGEEGCESAQSRGNMEALGSKRLTRSQSGRRSIAL